ncbi:MAG TPA: hypothetical protein VE988_04385, partial [Gemmataceae bacterium]|nr:hypothetical protein [Gemmataceae bacterium]
MSLSHWWRRLRFTTSVGQPGRKALDMRKNLFPFVPRLEWLEDRTLLSVMHPHHVIFRPNGGAVPFATAAPTGLSPADIRHAYGLDRVTLTNTLGEHFAGDGSGTTIAIVDAYDNPNIVNDLHQFDLQFGLPDPPLFTRVNQSGGTNLPPADAGWAEEIALDVEWAHAIAPKAKILLVEANDEQIYNSLIAIQYTSAQPGIVAISMSFGFGELDIESGLDQLFVTPTGHNGVTFVASSGDSGAPPSYPAISPNVLGVGGTTAYLDQVGNLFYEEGWGGSGGGISAYEAKPAYQNSVLTPSATKRTNPDVAYNSGAGFAVYDSYNNGSATPWASIGGTSAAAPQWAAMIAIADQGRALVGLGPLDGATQTLPALYQMPAADFIDITDGISYGNPQYSAAVGYDLVTGRGSPVADQIIQDLIGPAMVSSVPAEGAAVTTPPASYVVNFSLPINSASLQASDLVVDFSPATSVSLNAAGTTATFSFASNPLTVQGYHSMGMPYGAVTQLGSLASPNQKFVVSFYYDVLPTQVVSTVPAGHSVMTLNSPITLDVNFNEAVFPSTVEPADLDLFGIDGAKATAVTLLNGNTTARFTIDVASEGFLFAGIHAGAVYDAFSNRSTFDFFTYYDLEIGTAALSTPLTATLPQGSLIYNSTTSTASVGSGADTDSFTLNLDVGQKVTVVVHPTSTFLRPTATLRNPGNTIIATASAATAGQDVVLNSIPVATTGVYTITINGASSTIGDYTVQVILNAAADAESHGGSTNNSLATAQNLDGAAITLAAGASQLAVLGAGDIGPALFSADFETGNLPPTFTTYSSNNFGRVRVVAPAGTGNTSSFGLLMDSNTDGNYALNEAIYTVNLSGMTQAALSFLHINFADESDRLPDDFTGHVNGDGVAISADGSNWHTILNAPTQGTWTTFSIDLAAAAAEAGMTLGSNFKIKFQQYDNYTFSTDGRGYDNIQISGSDQDNYKLTLAAGDMIALAATAQTAGALLDLELRNSSDVVVATATGGATNFTKVITSYTAPSAGVYYPRVSANIGTDYSLVVTRNGTLDTEANNTSAAAQNLGVIPAVLGYLSDDDWYVINVTTTANMLLLQSSTPGDGIGEPVNAVNPHLELYSPANVLIATGNNLVDGRNELLSYPVPPGATGLYKVRVSSESGAGEYVLTRSTAPAPATHFQFSTPSAVSAGSAFNFSVTAFDQFGNTATAYTGTLHFTSSDSAATLPPDGTLISGVGIFSATLRSAITRTLTVADTVASNLMSDSSPITVSPGVATHFSLLATPPNVPPNASVTIVVAALDAFDSTAPSYTGTVHFTSSDAQALLPADATLTNGIGTFNATLKTVGSATVTATDTAISTITATSNLVTVAPLSVQAISMVNPALVSVGTGASSTHFAVSKDGRYVVFSSNATNLVPADTNGKTDVFLRDTQLGTILMVSSGNTGGGGNGDSTSPAVAVAPNGKVYIAFESTATDLGPSDTNGVKDIYLTTVDSGEVSAISLVSTDSASTQGNAGSSGPSVAVSSSGVIYIGFASDASNLVSGDTNSSKDVFVKNRSTGATTRISTDSAGVQGNSVSNLPAVAVAPNGNVYIAYQSTSTNLVSGDTNGAMDVFVKNMTTNATTRVSTDGTGVQANGACSEPSIAIDGSGGVFVAFSGGATNLVAGDTNGLQDIFVKNLASNATTIVSTDSGGAQINNSAQGPAVTISGGGIIYAAFETGATNLVSGDTNNNVDIFVKNLSTGTTTRVSTNNAGSQATGSSGSAALGINGNGDVVAVYSSVASNLVPGDTNGVQDAFVKNLTTGAVSALTRMPSVLLLAGANATLRHGVSPNARYVAFNSSAINVVPGDTNSTDDGFLRDTLLGTTSRVTTDSSGAQANGSSVVSAIAVDAGSSMYVCISSYATNLVSGDTNGVSDVFVKNLTTGIVSRVSTTSAGGQANGDSYAGDMVIDSSGTIYVVFASSANNLVPGDTNNGDDIFLKNLSTGAITRVSTSSAGSQGNGGGSAPTVAVSGTTVWVGFESYSNNLVVGDTNNNSDVFVKNLSTGVTTMVDTDSAGNQAGNQSNAAVEISLAVSGSGTILAAFRCSAGNLVSGDTNNLDDVFIKNLATGVTRRVSTNSSGNEADDYSYSTALAIASDGTAFVAFASRATNLVPGGTAGSIYLKNLSTGAIIRATTDNLGNPAIYGGQVGSLVSAGGSVSMSYSSLGPGLVVGNDIKANDVYLWSFPVFASATHFAVTAPATVLTGNVSTITVTALDASNNIALNFNGAVHFTSSDAQAVLPADLSLTNGVGTFSVTMKTAGSQTVTVSDSVTNFMTGISSPITVLQANPAPPTHFGVVVSPASFTAGNAGTITITALDASNNRSTSYAGMVRVTSGDAQALLPANSLLTYGMGTFTVALKTAGLQTFTATDTAVTSLTGTSNLIPVLAAPASHFAVSAPLTATAGMAFNVTLIALDPFNNTATGYSGTVAFSSTSAGSLPAAATLTSGAGTFSATLTSLTNQTITAADTVSSSVTGTSNSIKVNPIAATHFAVTATPTIRAGLVASVTLTALDDLGNTAIAYA